MEACLTLFFSVRRTLVIVDGQLVRGWGHHDPPPPRSCASASRVILGCLLLHILCGVSLHKRNTQVHQIVFSQTASVQCMARTPLRETAASRSLTLRELAVTVIESKASGEVRPIMGRRPLPSPMVSVILPRRPISLEDRLLELCPAARRQRGAVAAGLRHGSRGIEPRKVEG